MTLAYLNGEFLPLEQAKVSVMDRGFLFGDGVYEVIPVYQGQCFRLEQHLTRLSHSLAAIQLNYDCTALTPILHRLVNENGSGDQSLYLQITRGTALTRDFAFPEHSQATVMAYSMPLHSRTVPELQKGIAALTVTDIRWQRCDIKAITLLASVLLRETAKQQGKQEAILIRDGYAMEGTASNLFMVKNQVIITPPLGHYLLGGITRDLILELCTQHGLANEQRLIAVTELFSADEIWISSSIREILPVLSLNDQPVGNGTAGPLWYTVVNLYQDYKRSLKAK